MSEIVYTTPESLSRNPSTIIMELEYFIGEWSCSIDMSSSQNREAKTVALDCADAIVDILEGMPTVEQAIALIGEIGINHSVKTETLKALQECIE